jgi:hypothetical protein
MNAMVTMDAMKNWENQNPFPLIVLIAAIVFIAPHP